MRQLLSSDPKARILIFTMNDDPLLAAQMLEQGAKGFVSKCEDPTCIVTAIREVSSHRYYISPMLAQKIATLRINPSEQADASHTARGARHPEPARRPRQEHGRDRGDGGPLL